MGKYLNKMIDVAVRLLEQSRDEYSKQGGSVTDFVNVLIKNISLLKK